MQFELNFQDDEHDAEKSVNAYNALKDWGMQILVGTVTTGPCIAVGTETNADRIFTLTPSASSTDVIGGQPDASGNVSTPRKDNVFQMCFTDPNQGIASAQYISDQKLGAKIAVIYNNSDAYSTGIYHEVCRRRPANWGLEYRQHHDVYRRHGQRFSRSAVRREERRRRSDLPADLLYARFPDHGAGGEHGI